MRAADAALLTSALHPLHGKPAFAGSVLTGALLAMVALFGGSSRRASSGSLRARSSPSSRVRRPPR